jgi:cytochrome d ubiquinol oxidase subunit II
MRELGFFLAVSFLAAFALLDGFDLGAGMLHRIVARDERERRTVLAAIGPYWDANEVWLLAAGGVLFAFYPAVLAAGLSGFYLAIFLLVWGLILRGISIELRHHGDEPLFKSFLDSLFVLASTGIALVLGAALGNIIRGVPLDADGWFALPLFGTFWPGPRSGNLDIYTVSVGLFTVAALAHHGAHFLVWKTEGAVATRSARLATLLLPVVVVGAIALFGATFIVQPALQQAFWSRPWIVLFPLFAAAGLGVLFRKAGSPLGKFLASNVFLGASLAGIAAGLFPVFLRSTGDGPNLDLSMAAPPESLAAIAPVFLVGIPLAMFWFAMLFRIHRGKAHAAEGHDGY